MSQPVLNVVHALRQGEEREDLPGDASSQDTTSAEKTKRQFRPKTRFALPPDRLTTKAQLTVLRAYSAASEEGKRHVHYRYAADVARMHRSTVSSANPFFVEVGFLIRTDGELLPAPEVVAYKQAHEWNQETASLKLAPIVERSWFFTALRPKLGFGPVAEDEAIQKLAEECGASPGHAESLKMLIDYMDVSGLVERDGGSIKLAAKNVMQQPPDTRPTPKADPLPLPKEEPVAVRAYQPPPPPPPATPADGLRFSVNIHVNLTEMSSWQPDRIAAFFNGLAQVIAAKKGLDGE